MNVAVISTPRSGNTWVRGMLGEMLGVPTDAYNFPADLPGNSPAWFDPAAGFVAQIHWDRTPEMVDYLAAHRCRVVSIRRHPLDVLVSMLHFARREPQTDNWLGGGYTRTIRWKGPQSPEFAEFAVGDGAAHLLSVSGQWADVDVALTYEGLVADPEAAMRRVADDLGVEFNPAVLETMPFTKMRALDNRHGWQATPGLWRRLIVADLAAAVAERNPAAFAGYTVDADPDLTVDAAAANWAGLVL